jgi:hypothetical protein
MIKIFEKIAKRYGLRMEDLDLEFKRRVRIMYELYQRKIFKFWEVREIINRYYKQKEQLLKEFGIE